MRFGNDDHAGRMRVPCTVLGALLIMAGCGRELPPDGASGAGARQAAGASGMPPSRDAGPVRPPPCPLKPGSKFAPDTDANGAYVELCNAWDDDCDGIVDEGFDKDGDGYSQCESASELPADCDDTRPNVNPAHPELCDGIDNDCDGSWDEDHDAGCATPLCSPTRKCPDDLVCIFPGEPCATRAECPEIDATEAQCEPPERLFYPGPCDPSVCVRWQDGTCWGDCACADDGTYRWRVGCTE